MGIWVLSFLSWETYRDGTGDHISTLQLLFPHRHTDHFQTEGTHGKWTCTQHARSSCSMLLLLIMMRLLLLECSCAGHVSSSSYWCSSWSPAPTPTSSLPKQIKNPRSSVALCGFGAQGLRGTQLRHTLFICPIYIYYILYISLRLIIKFIYVNISMFLVLLRTSSQLV